MGKFELWARGCAETGTELWTLEQITPGTGLYMTKRPYMMNHREWWESPVYHIWINGETWETTMNVHEAYRMWERRKGSAA